MGRLIVFDYVLVLICLVSVSAQVLDMGPNTTVTSNCGKDGVEDANVIVVSDNLFSVTATCLNGNFVFNNTDTHVFYLTVSYTSSSAGNCVFENEAEEGAYHISLIVLRRDSWMQEFRITCTVTLNKDDSSSEINVIKGTIHEEEEAQSILQMTDVLGRVIKTTGVAIQKPVQLTLDVTNIPGAVGVQPDSCDAIAGEQHFPILRVGCGVGNAFKVDEGFTTSGSVSRSPYFQPSAAGSSTTVSYVCNVTFCTTPCDGTTCRTKHKRHSEDTTADEKDKYFVAATDVKFIVEPVSRAEVKSANYSIVSTDDVEVIDQEVVVDSELAPNTTIPIVETSTQVPHTTSDVLPDQVLDLGTFQPGQTNGTIVSVESETFSTNRTNLTSVNMTHGNLQPDKDLNTDSFSVSMVVGGKPNDNTVVDGEPNNNIVYNSSSSGQAPVDQLTSEVVLIEAKSEATTKGSIIQDRIIGSKTSKFAVGVVVVSLFALAFLGLCIAHCRKPRTDS